MGEKISLSYSLVNRLIILRFSPEESFLVNECQQSWQSVYEPELKITDAGKPSTLNRSFHYRFTHFLPRGYIACSPCIAWSSRPIGMLSYLQVVFYSSFVILDATLLVQNSEPEMTARIILQFDNDTGVVRNMSVRLWGKYITVTVFFQADSWQCFHALIAIMGSHCPYIGLTPQ